VRELPLVVPEGDAPLYARIAAALAAEVRRGRLADGDALPGTRSLAASLGVHRSTVIAAYRELEAQGLVESVAATATRVRASGLDARLDAERFSPRARVPEQSAVPLPARRSLAPQGPARPGQLVLAGGLPDLRLFPAAELARALRRALGSRDATSLLGYGDPRGDPRLRAALARFVSERRGLVASAEHVLVTRGSQMALALAARALVPSGGRVAVESFGYPPAWQALRDAGLEPVPVPVDAEGLDTAALARVHEEAPLSAIYVTPHHQYPTGVPLAHHRRLALLELAQRARVPVLEDDYDHELHYEGRPLLPLAHLDRKGVVVYLGTLSKVLAPGLRLGFVVAPTPLVERLSALRATLDRQGDLVVERAVAELFEEGLVERHGRKMRRVYQARRDALVSALGARLAARLVFEVPRGGMALWAHAPGVDVEALRERTEARGVSFTTAARYAFDRRPRPFVRLGFAALTEAELERAVRVLADAWPGARARGA
jgi:GntR family transcriptional regulator/MocR family aminotransferase